MIQYYPSITGSLTVNGSVFITGSINATAGITGSATTASYVLQAISSSYALTASYVNPLTQSLSVLGSIDTTGTITAQTLVVQTITSSIVYSSGSNIFGNSQSNIQQMTGSLRVTGSITSTGAATFSSSVTASGNILASNSSGDVSLKALVTGDYFPRIYIQRAGGTAKTNYQWSFDVGSAGSLFIENVTSGSDALIFSTTNAATFSSTVTTGGSITATADGGAGGLRLTLNNTGVSEVQYALLSGGSAGTGIFGIRNGSTGTNLVLINGTGAATFSSSVTAANHITISNSASIAASTTATILTLSTSVTGVYIVQANFGAQANAAYGSTLIVVANLGSFRIVTNGSGASAALTLSGANVQIANALGSPLTAYASAILVG